MKHWTPIAALAAAALAAGCASTTGGSVATGGKGRAQLLLASQEQVAASWSPAARSSSA